jgi:ribonuclease HII
MALQHNPSRAARDERCVYVLGTDEAGYGPNLGPLVIGACAWQVPNRKAADRLYDLLAAVVCSQAEEEEPAKLAIADSKQLYQPGCGVANLERGVLAALLLLERRCTRWREIWPLVDPVAMAQIDGLPWHDGFDEPLPRDAVLDELGPLAQSLLAGCEAACVQLSGLAASVIFPGDFNAAVTRCDNKAEVLSLATLRLAGRILADLPPGPAVVFCDKHGGRNRYAALLQDVFPEELVRVRRESAELSVYELRTGGRAVEFRFQPKGEQHLPTALASMTAKYLRELAMRPFNLFWQTHVPGLAATAGYPSDSRRFWSEIREAQVRLQITDEILWRHR